VFGPKEIDPAIFDEHHGRGRYRLFSHQTSLKFRTGFDGDVWFTVRQAGSLHKRDLLLAKTPIVKL